MEVIASVAFSLVSLRGSRDDSVGIARLTVSRCVVGSSPRRAEHFAPPVLRDWVIKGLGM